MTSLPNPFDSSAQMFLAPDEAAASSRSHAPDAAAEIQSSCGSTESRRAPSSGSGPLPLPLQNGDACSALEPPRAALVNQGRQQEQKHTVGVATDPQEDISLFELCIRGFDEAKFLFDIGCVPDDFDKYMALMEALTDNDEPPLFLQRTG